MHGYDRRKSNIQDFIANALTCTSKAARVSGKPGLQNKKSKHSNLLEGIDKVIWHIDWIYTMWRHQFFKCGRVSCPLSIYTSWLNICPNFWCKDVSSFQCVVTFCLECLRISLCIIREPNNTQTSFQWKMQIPINLTKLEPSAGFVCNYLYLFTREHKTPERNPRKHRDCGSKFWGVCQGGSMMKEKR